MELSVVLWNCNGPTVAGSDAARLNSCKSTMESWKKQEVVPDVVLAQEAKGNVRKKLITFSAAHSKGDMRDTTCFFPERHNGYKPDVEILDSGYLIAIRERMGFQPYEVIDVARIQCTIMMKGSEKILICSWHGRHSGFFDVNKKSFLRNMLEFVNKIKVDKGCCAVLVGGDFNLKSSTAKDVLSTHWPGKPKNAVLYDSYEKPSFRPDLIDYVIAWPSNRISQKSCRVIDTVPRQPEARMFDDALVRYNFTVRLRGKWEGDGEVTWRGEYGKGKVVLEHKWRRVNCVDVEGVESGQWKGEALDGYCRNFVKLEIIGRHYMSVKINDEWVSVGENEVRVLMQDEGDEVWWKGNGKIKWESAGAIEVSIECYGEQIIEWNGTGLVKWSGQGKASWVGGKLKKWEGNQIVKWADDQLVRWSGGGEVVFYGAEQLEHFTSCGRWTEVEMLLLGVEKSRKWCARGEKQGKLEWKGRGVTWEVTGTGTGNML